MYVSSSHVVKVRVFVKINIRGRINRTKLVRSIYKRINDDDFLNIKDLLLIASIRSMIHTMINKILIIIIISVRAFEKQINQIKYIKKKEK